MEDTKKVYENRSRILAVKALLTASFAALTASLAKVGLEHVQLDFATS